MSLLGSITLVGKPRAHLLFTSRRLALPLVIAAICLCTRGDHGPDAVPDGMPFSTVMPQTVVWAWEEPEDLRGAPSSVGVAYLAETIFLGKAAGAPLEAPAIRVLNRRQPLVVAPGAAVMAVVRIIALPGFRDSETIREQTASALTEAAHRQGLRAFQIDFDATRSQRAFYADVLHRLRPLMPTAMPLSITALVSWCTAEPASRGWLSTLPIDEAVPMFFRLGGSARIGDDKTGFQLREPLCRGSLGISTDESWPRLNRHARVYLFAPRPWTQRQLAALEGLTDGSRAPALQFANATANSHPPNDTGLSAVSRSGPAASSHSEEKVP